MNKTEIKKIVERIPHAGATIARHLISVMKGMDRGSRAVLSACVLTTAFFLLRLGFIDGWRGAVIAFALLVVDVGIALTMHVEARAHWERFEAWRARCEGRKQRQQALAAANSELKANLDARAKVSAEIRRVEDELKLRERLNFDLKQISIAAAAAAREGYLSGVDANKGRYVA